MVDECGVCNGLGPSTSGCDSIPLGACNCDGDVVTDTSFVAEQVCDEFLWNGYLYTTSGTYDWTGVGFEGCDSTAVLELTIWNSTNVELDSASCVGMTFDGVTIDASGTYIQSHQVLPWLRQHHGPEFHLARFSAAKHSRRNSDMHRRFHVARKP